MPASPFTSFLDQWLWDLSGVSRSCPSTRSLLGGHLCYGQQWCHRAGTYIVQGLKAGLDVPQVQTQRPATRPRWARKA